MKILFANNLYGERAKGGAEKVVAAEAEAFVVAGDSVVVVSAAPPSESEAALRAASDKNGVRMITYVPKNICAYDNLGTHGVFFKLFWHWLDIFNGSSAEEFEAILDEERPDVVHTHNLMGLGFMIPTMLRLRGTRHVHTVHDVQLLDPSGLLSGACTFHPAPHQAVYIAVMRRAMGSPDTVFFPSQFHLDLHARFGFFPKSKRVVLRNPAPASTPHPSRPEGAPITFLFAGQLELHKGVLDLLDAWERAGIVDARLEFAGKGSLSPVVCGRTSAMQDARLLEHLDRDQLAVAYDRADWVVVPSRVIENAPAVLMEAMSRGVPAVAAASGGIPEIVKEGENGILYPPGDVDALVAALKRAALSGALHDTFAARARETVAPWTVVAHVAQLREAYLSART